MTIQRLIELYLLLSNNSTIAKLGLTIRLDGEELKILRVGNVVGNCVYNGSHYVISRPACPERPITFETATPVVALVMNGLEDC